MALAVLGMLACGLGTFVAGAASAAETVRAGWTPLPYCSPCGGSPGVKVLQFADERTGWLAGTFGVARTDDGAKTWRLATGLPGAVERASFAGSRGVAVGSFEGVAVSSDGGLTWKQYRPIPGKVYDVQALPDRLLAATGGTLYSSADGLVWKSVGRFAGGDTFGSRIHFADASHGTAVSAVQVSTTHDGGRTWRSGISHGYYLTIRTGAFTRDATHSYAVGVSGKGPSEYVLEASSDGGASYGSPVVPPPPSVYRGLSDIAFAGDTGYAVGWEGTLLRSTDAGATWVRETPPPSFERTTFKAVAVLSPDRALAVTWGGGLVTRNAPAFTEVSHPYRGVGLGLAGLGVASLLGAGARVLVARPDLVAGSLVGAGLLTGAGGGAAITVTRDELLSVAPLVVEPEQAAAGVVLSSATPTASPVPSVTPSATAPASATPTPSLTAGPSPTPTPTPSRTTAGPLPTVTLTQRPTSAPPSTKPPGTFTVTPTSLSQTCSPNYSLPSFQVTLKNGTSEPVAWTLEYDHRNGEPWAASQYPGGTLPAGASQTITIYPNGQVACPGINGPTDYRLRVRQDTQASVGGPVLGTVTDRVSPPS